MAQCDCGRGNSRTSSGYGKKEKKRAAGAGGAESAEVAAAEGREEERMPSGHRDETKTKTNTKQRGLERRELCGFLTYQLMRKTRLPEAMNQLQ